MEKTLSVSFIFIVAVVISFLVYVVVGPMWGRIAAVIFLASAVIIGKYFKNKKLN
ncbi:MAG: hypothetical protein Q8Q06_04105 [bacterium]|nr:hypothetical protein [bacterium]